MNRTTAIAFGLVASIALHALGQVNPTTRQNAPRADAGRADAPMGGAKSAPAAARQTPPMAGAKSAPGAAMPAAQGNGQDGGQQSEKVRAPETAHEPVDFRSAVRAGEAAHQSGDFAGAAAAYEAALAARPDAADAAYNMGVSLYKAGKFQDAAKAFARASNAASNGEHTDAALSASSLYNRAASFYSATRTQAEAAQRMLDEQRTAATGEAKEGPEAKIDPEALKQAIADANKSLGGFKDAAYANPADQESRANAEQSLRLIRALEELKKKQDEQQKKDDKKDKDNKKDQG
ncbi:MAG: tetratricopeptide repeat protein, partial [Planctomycetota bacterium]